MQARTIGLAAMLSAMNVALVTASAWAQSTTRVSVDSSGSQASGDSGILGISISSDGRYVAFESVATDLVSRDGNGKRDVFVRDRLTGVTERVSVSPQGRGGDDESLRPSISADGRFVAFESWAANLVSGDTNHWPDVFVRDRWSGVTERVSIDSVGTEANYPSGYPSISADGRHVAFWSDASNLVAADTNQTSDIFVHDRQSGATERVSVDFAGAESDSTSLMPVISADGRCVAFSSFADNLDVGDTNGTWDVFVHDRQSGATELVSVDSSGAPGNLPSGLDTLFSAISADGRCVAFCSDASNLVSGDTNGSSDIFVHDCQSGTTERVSIDSSGVEGSSWSWNPSMSADGRHVAFASSASNLVPGDTNSHEDIFVHDRQSGATIRASVDSSGGQGNGDSGDFDSPVISADARQVAFSSVAGNLVPADTNTYADIFVHGAWLTLEADPVSPTVGSTLTMSTWTGEASGTVLLVITDVNGAPMFVPAVFGVFDPAGLWMVSNTVPSGLSGNTMTFETFGIVPTGKADVSNPFAVSFQ